MTNARHLIWLALAALALSGCSDRSAASVSSPSQGEGRERVSGSSSLATAPQPLTPAGTPRLATDPRPLTTAVRDITFDTIKFEMRKEDPFARSMLTPAIERLDGTRVRIRGYILPSFQQSGLAQFVLVRDNMECCFGPGAALFDCIVVEMLPGLTTEFTTRPVAVEGEFSIREILGPDDRHVAIYHLDGEKVQ